RFFHFPLDLAIRSFPRTLTNILTPSSRVKPPPSTRSSPASPFLSQPTVSRSRTPSTNRHTITHSHPSRPRPLILINHQEVLEARRFDSLSFSRSRTDSGHRHQATLSLPAPNHKKTPKTRRTVSRSPLVIDNLGDLAGPISPFVPTIDPAANTPEKKGGNINHIRATPETSVSHVATFIPRTPWFPISFFVPSLVFLHYIVHLPPTLKTQTSSLRCSCRPKRVN
ncbi:hypothetical protein CH063_08879, partial [Colletotrichum higginsianum]